MKFEGVRITTPLVGATQARLFAYLRRDPHAGRADHPWCLTEVQPVDTFPAMPPRVPNGGRGSTRRASSKAQSLLVLHLDADRLRQDGLHLGEIAQLSGLLSALGLGSRVRIEDATTLASLRRLLLNLVPDGATFDVVAVVAHSNADGIKIASDPLRSFVSWKAFGKYLKPLRPRRLLLIACTAGRSDAADALFSSNPDLRRIYACPVTASKDFGTLMLATVPYIVAERRPNADHVLLAQLASVAVTGRQLREWKRTTDHQNPEGLLHDVLADLSAPLVEQIPSILEKLLRP